MVTSRLLLYGILTTATMLRVPSILIDGQSVAVLPPFSEATIGFVGVGMNEVTSVDVDTVPVSFNIRSDHTLSIELPALESGGHTVHIIGSTSNATTGIMVAPIGFNEAGTNIETLRAFVVAAASQGEISHRVADALVKELSSAHSDVSNLDATKAAMTLGQFLETLDKNDDPSVMTPGFAAVLTDACNIGALRFLLDTSPKADPDTITLAHLTTVDADPTRPVLSDCAGLRTALFVKRAQLGLKTIRNWKGKKTVRGVDFDVLVRMGPDGPDGQGVGVSGDPAPPVTITLDKKNQVLVAVGGRGGRGTNGDIGGDGGFGGDGGDALVAVDTAFDNTVAAYGGNGGSPGKGGLPNPPTVLTGGDGGIGGFGGRAQVTGGNNLCCCIFGGTGSEGGDGGDAIAGGRPGNGRGAGSGGPVSAEPQNVFPVGKSEMRAGNGGKGGTGGQSEDVRGFVSFVGRAPAPIQSE